MKDRVHGEKICMEWLLSLEERASYRRSSSPNLQQLDPQCEQKWLVFCIRSIYIDDAREISCGKKMKSWKK